MEGTRPGHARGRAVRHAEPDGSDAVDGTHRSTRGRLQALQRRRVQALYRLGRRRRLDDEQRARRAAGVAREERRPRHAGDRLDHDRPDGRDGQHDLRRNGRGERLVRQRGRPRRLQVDRRRQPLVGASGQRRGGEGPRRRRHRDRPDEPEPHLHRDDGRSTRHLELERRTLHAAGRTASRPVRVEGRRQHVHAHLLA